MNKPIYDFFEQDHRRIEAILDEATKDFDNIDMELYSEFRIGLLTHIKMEENLFFPAAQKANGGEPVPFAKQLRLEHGAITSLMVPPPNEEIVKVLKYILEKHDEIEEMPGGMYDICENLTKEQTSELLVELRSMPLTPVQPHNEKPYVVDVAKRVLARAGFDWEEILSEVNHQQSITEKE